MLLLLSRFSRVRLCNPIDGSPPGSLVPGILHARVLEWVAMNFNYSMRFWKWLGKEAYYPRSNSAEGESVRKIVSVVFFFLSVKVKKHVSVKNAEVGKGRDFLKIFKNYEALLYKLCVYFCHRKWYVLFHFLLWFSNSYKDMILVSVLLLDFIY